MSRKKMFFLVFDFKKLILSRITTFALQLKKFRLSYKCLKNPDKEGNYKKQDLTVNHPRRNSSRLDTGLMHDPKLIWASGESETKGKAGKVCGSNLMI